MPSVREHLRVKRKGYTRKDGTRVRASKSFLIEDRGAPGRTPKENRWFHPEEGALGGWSKDLPAHKRRAILDRLVRKDSYRIVVDRLLGLGNVSTDRKTDAAVRSDLQYLRTKYR